MTNKPLVRIRQNKNGNTAQWECGCRRTLYHGRPGCGGSSHARTVWRFCWEHEQRVPALIRGEDPAALRASTGEGDAP